MNSKPSYEYFGIEPTNEFRATNILILPIIRYNYNLFLPENPPCVELPVPLLLVKLKLEGLELE